MTVRGTQPDELAPATIESRCPRCKGDLTLYQNTSAVTQIGGPGKPLELRVEYFGAHVCGDRAGECPHDLEPVWTLAHGGDPYGARCRMCRATWPLGERSTS
jgi:hypothetical protein